MTAQNSICTRLLHHMGQLMSNQPLSFMSLGCELAGTKDNMVSDRIRLCIDMPRRRCCRIAYMHPDSGEVVAKPLFHDLPYRGLQWPACAGKDVIDAARRRNQLPVGWPSEALDPWWCRADWRMGNTSHHLIRHPIRLPLQRIILGADRQLALAGQGSLIVYLPFTGSAGSPRCTRGSTAALALEPRAFSHQAEKTLLMFHLGPSVCCDHRLDNLFIRAVIAPPALEIGSGLAREWVIIGWKAKISVGDRQRIQRS
jgi:hypothetical protein